MLSTLDRKPLGQLLIDRGALKTEHLQRALDEQRRGNHQKLLGELLVEQSACTEEQVGEALAEGYGVPYARVSPRLADPKVIDILPRDFLERHQILPLFLVERVLTIAVPEPTNVFLIEEIERLSGFPVQVVAATAREIRATLQSYLPSESVFVIDEAVDDVGPEEFTLIDRRTAGPAASAESAAAGPEADGAPVAKLINYCIYNAVKQGASDVHIEPGESDLRVRYRIDGRLVERLRPPHAMHAAIAARLKAIVGLNPAELRLPQDGEVRAVMGKRAVDLRVATMPGRYGEKLVVRILDNEKSPVNLEKLGFGYETLKQWRKLLSLPSGILLVTGPSDSGKSSTLYASLREMDSAALNICTVEDPVEYALPGINQFQADDRAGLTFTASLRAVLRQEPDVLMVGELRDPETAKLAAQAALTGRLVLSTLHTADAPAAVARLFNLGLEPYLVGASLAGVLAQRLVRKLCQNCREPYAPAISERRQLEKAVGGAVDMLYRPKGCSRCRSLGFSGRVGIHELLPLDEPMADKVCSGVTLRDLRAAVQAAGLKSLRTDGLEKVKAGITTLEEVFRVTG